jgi:uncharacterized OB-fold protein
VSYFLEGMPKPEPIMDDEGFWQHCARRKLAFQACADCSAPRHPPTPVCWKCRSLKQKWVEVSGEGEVFSFTEVHHALHGAVLERVPYIVVLVSFADLPGPRLVSNLTDISLARVHIGMKVRLWWDDIGDGMFLPRFRPAVPIGDAT